MEINWAPGKRNCCSTFFGKRTKQCKQQLARQGRQLAALREEGQAAISCHAVLQYTHAGSIIAANASVAEDVDSRVRQARAAGNRLTKRCFAPHELQTSAKIQLLQSLVFGILYYGSEL